MLIPESIIQRIQADPVEGAIGACRFCIELIDEFQNAEWTEDEHEVLLETYALISALREAELIKLMIVEPNLSGTTNTTCQALLEHVRLVEGQLVSQSSKNKLDSLKKHFSVTVTKAFGYEFSDGDVKRIQTLLNELRGLVADADDIHNEHKQRLLQKLEQLQKELHKRTSDLSRYYGLFGEAGVALGKFGTNAKPIVDRIKEILQITWNAQARAEELPSGSAPPLLEKDTE